MIKNIAANKFRHSAFLYIVTYFVVMLCNSWIHLRLRNEPGSNESFSMNVFRVRGIAFIPYRRKYMHAEKVTLRPIKGYCLDAINFK
jgi:hypothetical protein